jgi:tetratricopeptide (TPR) repeat protein
VRSIATLCCLVAWASASHALAFSEDALCALEDRSEDERLYTPAEEQLSSEDDSGNLCLLETEPAALAGLPGPVPPDASAGLGTAETLPDARAHLRKAEAFVKAGKREDALLELRVVERAVPRIADRFALQRGDLLIDLGLPEQACEAYEIAAESVNREIAIRAQIGSVQCMLQSGNKKAERALQALLTRYPRLPQRHQLDFELAMARERAGSPRAAVALLQHIDLTEPASGVAERARTELERLAKDGVRIPAYSAKERVERVGRLVFDGPFEQATAEVDALLEDRSLGAELHAQALALSARIARIQGRFGQANPVAQRAAKASPGTESSDADAAREAAERRIRSLRAGKPIARLGAGPLRSVFELAVAHRLTDVCDEALDAMRTRKRLDASVRFDAAIRASGLASDEKLAELFETLLDVPRYRLAARYHYARALERLGRTGEAEVQYLRVIASDRGLTQYYSMWSDLRLWTIKSQSRESCLPHAAPSMASADRDGSGPLVTAAQRAALDGHTQATSAKGGDDGSQPAEKGPVELQTRDDGAAEGLSPQVAALVGSIVETPGAVAAVQNKRIRTGQRGAGRVLTAASMLGRSAPAPDVALDSVEARRQRVLDLLLPIAARHAEAYPWLDRARDLVELDLFTEAADEINEAYLAFRDVTGALRLRSGLLALLTGSAPPRRSVTFAVAKARRALDRDTRMVLSEVANLLGDPGVGVRFGRERLDERPRAYAELVESAAHKYGLDSNLLFAVMRVESIYNRRIISNAGAVGLMQIMPATGERIARQLGVGDFDASELLDPQLNLDFSAWYFASLLQRFEGRLPLAIASYNGGPHNVRLWMRANPPKMPLDAFLERIPFSQTHEYVRRVLTYYAQYRAQQNLPMTRLSVDLPQLRPDTLAF